MFSEKNIALLVILVIALAMVWYGSKRKKPTEVIIDTDNAEYDMDDAVVIINKNIKTKSLKEKITDANIKEMIAIQERYLDREPEITLDLENLQFVEQELLKKGLTFSTWEILEVFSAEVVYLKKIDLL